MGNIYCILYEGVGDCYVVASRLEMKVCLYGPAIGPGLDDFLNKVNIVQLFYIAD